MREPPSPGNQSSLARHAATMALRTGRRRYARSSANIFPCMGIPRLQLSTRSATAKTSPRPLLPACLTSRRVNSPNPYETDEIYVAPRRRALLPLRAIRLTLLVGKYRARPRRMPGRSWSTRASPPRMPSSATLTWSRSSRATTVSTVKCDAALEADRG